MMIHLSKLEVERRVNSDPVQRFMTAESQRLLWWIQSLCRTGKLFYPAVLNRPNWERGRPARRTNWNDADEASAFPLSTLVSAMAA